MQSIGCGQFLFSGILTGTILFLEGQYRSAIPLRFSICKSPFLSLLAFTEKGQLFQTGIFYSE